MKQIFKKIMWIIISLIALVIVGAVFILSQPKFGKNPDGKSDKISRSKNYQNGSFKNLSESPVFSGDGSIVAEAFKFFLQKVEHRQPLDSLPFVKSDLKQLDKTGDVLIWFGHSSYYIQVEGTRILVDPVLDGNAAPFSSMNKAFAGTDWYKAANIPDIDYLFITHDHWDHLDYQTISRLKDRVEKVICPLGVGLHLEHWGLSKAKVTELDWHERAGLASGWETIAMPARHYSGRGLQRNKTLWASFVLKTPTKSIYIGGDSGYDTHFAEIGNKYGPFDLAVLELGQYHNNWKYIHLLPEHFFPAANDLKAQRVLPVHNSKFALGRHAWFDPLQTITALSKNSDIPLLTPMIGEPVYLNDSSQVFSRWWKERK